MDLELANRADELFDSLETYKTPRFHEMIKELREIIQPMIDNERNKETKNRFRLQYSYGNFTPYKRISQTTGNLNAAIALYEEASNNLERMHAATQDALHALELCEMDEKETVKIAQDLRDIRKIRREAKDFTELMLPFYDLACRLKEQGIIKELNKVSVEILRNTEAKAKRNYTPRELTELEPKFKEGK